MTTTPPLLLTKREYFAAFAMQGYLAAHAGATNMMPYESEVAKNCVGYADGLLAELAATAPAPAPPMTYGPPPPGYYEAQEALRKALAADPTWTPYDGGPRPCAPDMQVQVKYRCGETDTTDRADVYLWSWTEGPYDIVAWRAVP